MRIAYLVSLDPYRSNTGTEFGARILAEAMVARGHEITIFHGYTTQSGGINSSSVRVVGVQHSGVRYIAGFEANMKVLRLLRRENRRPFDVVDLFGAGLGLAFSGLPGSPSLNVFHAIDAAMLEWASLEQKKLASLPFHILLALGERLAVNKAQTVIALTHGTRSDLEALYPCCVDRVTVVPFPLQDEWFLSAPPEQQRHHFLYIGAGQRRRTDIFLKALACLQEKGLPIRGTVLREPRNEFYGLARKLGIDVDFFSGLPLPATALRNCFSTAYALILPSRREGMCIPVIQAASQLTPTISTPLPAVADFLQDGANGMFVDSADPAEWAEKMYLLASDPQLRQRLGTNARSKAEAYRASSVVLDLEDVYARQATQTH